MLNVPDLHKFNRIILTINALSALKQIIPAYHLDAYTHFYLIFLTFFLAFQNISNDSLSPTPLSTASFTCTLLTFNQLPPMAHPEIEEFASEDIGFQLASGKHGVQLFDDPVDFLTVVDSPLHLLSVGNIKKIYAVSNTNEVAVGRLADLNSLDSAKLNLHTVLAPSVTCLSFDSNNETLYGVSASNVMSIPVSDFLQGSPVVTQVTTSGDVATLSASPASPLLYYYLKNDKSLVIVHGDESSISDINAAAWSILGQSVGAVSDTKFHIFDVRGNPLLTHEFPDVQLKAVSCVDSNNWFLLGIDSDDEINFLVTVESKSIKSISSVPLAPPFGDAERADSLYSTSLINWASGTSYAFITSALSTDIATVECGNETKLVTQLNDTDRAELPMDDDSGDDTLPVGFCIDVSATDVTVKEPCQGVDEAVGVLPRLLCLNNLGNLIIWYVFDTTGLKKGTVSLSSALEAITPSEVSAGPSEPDEPSVSEGPEPGPTVSSPKKEDVKPAFGSSGFGSSGFGSSGFGQTSFDLSTQEKAGSSGFGSSGFGSSGFGNASFGTNMETAKPVSTSSAVGASGFGGATFGQSSFGSKPAFGSTGFGSASGAGSAASSSKPSNFGSFATSSFSSSKPGPSPFGESDKSTPSPFGTIGTSKPSPFGSTGTSTASPFGNIKAKESPFGESKSIESPFGAAKTTESPFGATKSFDSPFGATKPAESSFASEKEKDTESSFASEKATEPPFASLQESKDSSPKPVGELFDSSNTLGKLNLSDEPAKTPTTPLFGSGFGSTKDDSSKPSTDDDTTNKQESKAESTENKKPFEFPAFGSSLDKSEPSPFSKLTTWKPKEEKSRDVDADEPRKAVEQETESAKSEPKQAEPQNTETSSVADSNALTSVEGPEMYQSLEEIKETAKAVGGLEISEPKKDPILESTTKDGSAIEAEKKAVDESEPSKDSDKIVDGEENTVISESDEEQGDDVEKVEEEAEEEEEDEVFEEEDDDDDEEEEEEEEEESAPRAPEFNFQPLLTFGGWTSSPRRTINEVTNKIVDLVEKSDAQIALLERNASDINHLISECDYDKFVYGTDQLEDPDIWSLAVAKDATEIARNINVSVEKDLINARSQDESLSKLVNVVEKCDSLKEQLSRIVSEIAIFKQELESPKTLRRPLDIKSQALCYKLRKKFSKIQTSHNSALEKIVQLTLKQQIDRSFVKKMGQVVYEIHAKCKVYRDEFDKLEALLDDVAPTQALPGPQLGTGFTNFKTQKWRFAAKYANPPAVKNVSITQI